LERLVAGRRVLLALHQELAARGGRLEEWRAWPVPWPYRRGSRCRVLSLDGEGMMRLPACWEERRPFGLLWGGGRAVPPMALAAQGVGPTWTPFGVPLSRGETPVLPRPRAPRQRLQERIDALHDGGTGDRDLSLLALAIPPRGMAILETVGQHPLLPATDI